MFGPLIFFMLMYVPGVSAGGASIETKRLFKVFSNFTQMKPGTTKVFDGWLHNLA